MNYYQHHIGDFNNATRHLSRVERSIYSDLLDLYYDTEKPLSADFDKLARRILVEDNERGALREVLNEFFVAMEDGYHNERCNKEIASYQRMAEGGKLGAAKRWAKPGDSPPIATLSPPHAKGNANHEPRTMNHEPVTNEIPDGFALFWSAYPKKTAKPAALKAFKAKKINGELPQILADIDRRASSPDWKKEGGQYIPNPATYLNNRRWEDQTGQQTANIWAGAI